MNNEQGEPMSSNMEKTVSIPASREPAGAATKPESAESTNPEYPRAFNEMCPKCGTPDPPERGVDPRRVECRTCRTVYVTSEPGFQRISVIYGGWPPISLAMDGACPTCGAPAKGRDAIFIRCWKCPTAYVSTVALRKDYVNAEMLENCLAELRNSFVTLMDRLSNLDNWAKIGAGLPTPPDGEMNDPVGEVVVGHQECIYALVERLIEAAFRKA